MTDASDKGGEGFYPVVACHQDELGAFVVQRVENQHYRLHRLVEVRVEPTDDQLWYACAGHQCFVGRSREGAAAFAMTLLAGP